MDIKKEEFQNTPLHTEGMAVWLNQNKNKIQIVGETRRPYRVKTKHGRSKASQTEIITIYYKEK